MGSLIAHELALGRNLVPTLLMKSKKSLDVYTNNGSAITVSRPLQADSITSTVPVKAHFAMEGKIPGDEPIKNLIVATKTYSTADALLKYIPHIDRDTNIVFLQNGMGVVPQVRRLFWPNPADAPKVFHAISTHGAFKTSPNVVHHVGLGNLLISRIPNDDESMVRETLSNSYLETPEIIQALIEAKHLEALCVPYPQFILKQMEKLVVNACINPLTTALDCLNGDLLYAKNIVPTMNKVISECVECFKKEFDVFNVAPEAGVVLSRDRLLLTVLSVCRSTAKNSSSMREDMHRLNTTEIDSINGYIVDIGFRKNVHTPANRMLLDLVRNKLSIERAKENEALHRSFYTQSSS